MDFCVMGLDAYRFLVVDDHFLLRQMVSTTLKNAGVNAIDFATDGEDALQKINQAQSSATNSKRNSVRGWAALYN